jgi:hypothetical protein
MRFVYGVKQHHSLITGLLQNKTWPIDKHECNIIILSGITISLTLCKCAWSNLHVNDQTTELNIFQHTHNVQNNPSISVSQESITHVMKYWQPFIRNSEFAARKGYSTFHPPRTVTRRHVRKAQFYMQPPCDQKIPHCIYIIQTFPTWVRSA